MWWQALHFHFTRPNKPKEVSLQKQEKNVSTNDSSDTLQQNYWWHRYQILLILSTTSKNEELGTLVAIIVYLDMQKKRISYVVMNNWATQMCLIVYKNQRKQIKFRLQRYFPRYHFNKAKDAERLTLCLPTIFFLPSQLKRSFLFLNYLSKFTMSKR